MNWSADGRKVTVREWENGAGDVPPTVRMKPPATFVVVIEVIVVPFKTLGRFLADTFSERIAAPLNRTGGQTTMSMFIGGELAVGTGSES
jgi:hypothetical protein